MGLRILSNRSYLLPVCHLDFLVEWIVDDRSKSSRPQELDGAAVSKATFSVEYDVVRGLFGL